MKSANLSWFALFGGACAMLLVGSGACDVSSEGLGALSGGNGEGNASGTGDIDGTSPGTGNSTGQDAGEEPNSGGAMGAGGVMGGGGTPGLGGGKGGGGGGGSPGGGGSGGANAGGMAGMAAGGSAPNMGGMAGMNAGGVTGMAGMNAGGGGNTGGTNTGGAPGTGGMNAGGMSGAINDYNTQPTPGKVRCGNTECNADEYCCASAGPDKCQQKGKACPAGAYRGCDDQQDCALTQVCCGGMLDGKFLTGCIMPSLCSGGEVVICANSSQCGEDRLCCPRTIESMSMGVCSRTCQ